MNNYADTAGLEVTFFGESVSGQFLFGNGVPIADTVFNTLPEAVTRFGSRIETGGGSMQYSGAWADGRAHALAGKAYSPAPWKLQPQSRKEYGLGYLRGLLDVAERPLFNKPALIQALGLAPAIALVQEAPVLTAPKKKRGRPRKAQ